MSIRLMAAAWELPIPATEKMVLLCLCDHANDEGVCWPSIDRLAGKCSTSDRTIQRTLKALVARGILAVDVGGGKGRSSRYFINPDKLSPMAANPDIDDANPDTVSPEPSRTIIESSKGSASDDAPLTPDEIVSDWNELAKAVGLSAVVKLTEPRKRQVKARLREFPDLSDWQKAFANIRGSPFLLGKNDKGWKADFDFMVQAKSFPKLVEGSYGQA